jgi:protein TonB
MEKDKKKPQFINQPEYPGGPKEMTKFLYGALRYPAAAFEANIEGSVLVEYGIDYKGNVIETRVLQGIGHGCDEEACRVIKLMKFDVGKNRGVKVLFHRKARIQFKKPAPQPVAPVMQIQYTFTETNPTPTPQPESKPAETTYSYTIQF